MKEILRKSLVWILCLVMCLAMSTGMVFANGGSLEVTLSDGQSITVDDATIKSASSITTDEENPWTNAKGNKYVGTFYKLTDILTSAGVENISDAHGITTVASDGFTNGFAQSDLDNIYIYDMGEVLKDEKAAGNAGTYGTALNGGAGNKWAKDIVTVNVVNDHQPFVKNGVEYTYCSICGEEISSKPEADVFRIAGDTRYKTAFKNADKLKELQGGSKFDSVVVATGTNYPDALSGSYFASKNNAPLLLIDKSSADSVGEYIKSNVNAGGKIFVLGGESAVPKTWLSGFDGYTIDRIAGATRFETNLKILEASGYTGGNILVATGSNYADSLSGSSLDMPILLVNGKGSLTSDQIAFLRGKNAQIYIAGGTVAVSENMEASLGTYGKVVKRLAGNTRYETSSLIANEFFPNAKMAVLAVGNKFPDGLSAGPVATKLGAPLLLTNNDAYSCAAEYAKGHNINNGFVIGGTDAELISDDTAKAVFSADKIAVYGE
ncbi:MAG: cell wall-binding repeat-containing protein [Bacillota bacterium]|nr:cell wall-binding repeat-containing protein [Bacillota bacterium]